MIKTRKSIFETNSSSTHSIVIAGGNVPSKLPEEIEFNAGEFGWEWEIYNDVRSRADYLYTSILYCGLVDELIPILTETLESWGITPHFAELVKKECSCQSKEHYYYDFKDTFGYVDHGHENEDFVREVCNDETLLLNYLFGPDSYIATGNDNEDDNYESELPNPTDVLKTYFKGN